MSQFLSSFSFPFLSLLFLLFHQSFILYAASNNPNIIEQTCKRCASIDSDFNYNLCVSLLDSNPNSYKADLSGLGVISLNIAKLKAARVQSTIQKLLKSTPDNKKYEKACLNDCLELYTDAISSLEDSVGAIKSGRIDDARTWISAAVDAATTCENGFQEGGLSSLLLSFISKENIVLHRKMMKGNHLHTISSSHDQCCQKH